MVLAAGGETLWHLNSAAAAQGSSRLGAPTAGLIATPEASSAANPALNAAKSNAAESGAAMMTDPLFKPFVYVELPIPENYTLVQDAGLHMNNDGVVVATMNDGQDNYGFIWYDEEFVDGWQGPLEDGSGDIVLDDFGLRGINDEREICGTRSNSGPKAFFLALSGTYVGSIQQIGSGYAKDLNNQGVVVGTAAGGSPVGWWDTVTQPVPLPGLPSGDGTNAVGVTPNTMPFSSLIVGQCKDSSSKYQAVVWWYDGSWQVEDLTGVTGSNVGFAIDVNDDDIIAGGKLSGGSISDTILWYYDGGEEEWVRVSQGTSPDFVPEAINDQQYPEVVGENYLWICDDVASGTGTQIDLSAYALGLPTNMINMNCTDINDAGEIVGVGQLGSAGDWVAFKLVPYDVNNNGESDVREIALTYEDDDNGNWLIDSAESVDTGSGFHGMRVGLHSPNAANQPEGMIDPVQIVRLGVNLGPHGLSRSTLVEDEDWIEDIVDPTSGCDCEVFYNAVHAWGTGEGRADEDLTSEILIRVHSMMADDTYEDYETLPDPSSPDDHDEALAYLKDFSYRFARCIDYLQWGNESFGGARQYVFRGDEFNSACDFTTAPKAFSQLSDTCKAEAIDLILEWQREQMWAALEGSALAGRPLRMTSAGIFSSSVINGYDSNNHGRYLVTTVSNWCNDNQVYFALHNHYTSVTDATDAITKLVDTYSGSGAPWDVPNWRISTELGARADFSHDWWSLNDDANRREFARFFLTGDGDPSETYESFVGGWLSDGDGQWDGNGAGLDTVFDTYAESGFAAACWSALQWQTGTTWDTLSPYLIEGLRANQVRNDPDFFQSGNYTNRFTPLMDAYIDEDAGGAYSINNFLPHEEGCDVEEVCPECN